MACAPTALHELAREQEPIRGLTSKPLTLPPPLRESMRKKRRRDEFGIA
jgi:hypothetical protein